MAIDSIEPKDLKKKMEDNPETILIDCREQAEWDENHVDGFTLIPLSCFEQSLKVLQEKDKDSEIHIMCRSGKRSLNACMFLEENGFKNLYNCEGGILAWMEEGFEVK